MATFLLYNPRTPEVCTKKLQAGETLNMFRTKSRYWSVCLLVLMLALPFAANAQDNKDKKDKDKKEKGIVIFLREPDDKP